MPGSNLPRRALLLGAALVTLAAFAALLAPSLARRALVDAARRRGYAATFAEAKLGWGPRLSVSRLVLVRAATGDTALFADSLEVRLALFSLLSGRVRPAAVRMVHARLVARAGSATDPDSLQASELPARSRSRKGRAPRRERVDRSHKVREAASQVVRAILLPARTLPALDLRDVTLIRPSSDTADASPLGLHLEHLHLSPEGSGAHLEAGGRLDLERPVAFTGRLSYGGDDRLTGAWTFDVPDPEGPESWPLAIRVDGRVHQDRRRGVLEVREPTRLEIGEIGLNVTIRLDREGPALHVAVAADSLTGERLKRSLPPPVLGPLAGLATRGRWDYRVGLDLDLARPDSVDFAADVIPHGLSLDYARSRLVLPPLEGPFTAVIHLPRGRMTARELSSWNPHFRRLDDLDSELVAAVVTNEDGAFFRHRGFNTEAVREAIAENIRAGGFRRGAGTITMQLARNLWLGHDRTLSRKAQEVILAWVLEHLTGLPKERLLEIYLNIIEWGPGLHGADEAARFYFDKDAGRLHLDEALFLAILVPSPNRWKWRLDETGRLRQYAREQMHFIGRAMIAKGWLDAGRLPPVDQLDIELRGEARRAFEGTTAPLDSLDLDTLTVSVSPAHPLRAPASR